METQTGMQYTNFFGMTNSLVNIHFSTEWKSYFNYPNTLNTPLF